MNQPGFDFSQSVSPVDRILRRTTARAERVIPDFTEKASAVILAALETGPASGEALVEACKRAGLTPPDDRAFGTVFRKLARRGSLRCVGFALRAKGHGTSGGRIWSRA